MSLDVTKFASNISKRGLASPNKFQVKFENMPTGVMGNGVSTQDLSLMCESVAIAGRTVQSILDRQYGVNREIAYNGPTYTPITLSFLCSGDFAEKKIFDAWNNKIVDISNGWDVAYYSDYAKAKMTVAVLDKTATEEKYIITYHECFPKSVAAIEMNHSTTNTTLRMTIEMAYAYWETDDIKIGIISGATTAAGSNVPPSRR